MLAATCLLSYGHAFSAESQLGVGVNYGAGLASCGTWTEQRKTDEFTANLLLQWVMGYISAVNDFNPDSLSKTDQGAIRGFLDKYCTANPTHPLKAATAGLMLELMKHNGGDK